MAVNLFLQIEIQFLDTQNSSSFCQWLCTVPTARQTPGYVYGQVFHFGSVCALQCECVDVFLGVLLSVVLERSHEGEFQFQIQCIALGNQPQTTGHAYKVLYSIKVKWQNKEAEKRQLHSSIKRRLLHTNPIEFYENGTTLRLLFMGIAAIPLKMVS